MCPTPRKTDFEHFLTGTKSQAKPDAEALPPGRPKYPRGLSAEAKSAFKRLCGVLEKRRALTDGDADLLRLYGVVYDRHIRALAKLQEQGEVCIYVRLDSNGTAHDVEKPNYWLKIAETAEKNLVAILDRLGLTPLNRSKVRQTAKPAAKPVDPEAIAAEEFMQRVDQNAWIAPQGES